MNRIGNKLGDLYEINIFFLIYYIIIKIMKFCLEVLKKKENV